MPTIGVAIALPEPWATQLQEYRTALGDETAGLIPTHITLVPPVELTEEQGGDAARHLEQAAAATDSFLILGPLAVPLQHPYHPHVTVAHHRPEDVMDRAFAELATFDCTFDVERFHLYRHDDATGWRPVRDFSLRAAP